LPSGSPRPHVRSIETLGAQDHVAHVAARLFYRGGIHAAGVDRIALEAGVTKRTLYHHYSSKDDLITAALRVSPIITFPRDGTPIERILGAFTALKEFLACTDRNHPGHVTWFSGALRSGMVCGNGTSSRSPRAGSAV